MTVQKETAAFRVISPVRASGGGGALALIALRGDIDAMLARLGIRPVAVGAVVLRDLAGVDTGVVMRMGEREAVITPHAGPAVVKRLIEKLREAGVEEWSPSMRRARDVQTLDDITRVMQAVVAKAVSPAAVDVLLDQPRRWKELFAECGVRRVDELPPEMAAGCVNPFGEELSRLIEPATVAAWGPANIGKSTLLNALAKRSVSMVADMAGTTRDHVGVMLELGGADGGVVVRYVDTPGIVEEERAGLLNDDHDNTATGVDRAAQRLAAVVVEAAEVVVLCADAGGAFLEPPVAGESKCRREVRAWLRADREALPRSGAAVQRPDVTVSAKTGAGLEELVRRVRECVVSDAALADPRAWRFWESP